MKFTEMYIKFGQEFCTKRVSVLKREKQGKA